MNIKYLCARWQGLLEHVVNLVGSGYYYVHVLHLPGRKKHKWEQIDTKIINKYQLADQTKDKRYHRKKKGLANFQYVRWQNIGVILHTEGKVVVPPWLEAQLLSSGVVPGNVLLGKQQDVRLNQKQRDLLAVCYDDLFFDIRVQPLELRISDEVSFDIQFIQKIHREPAVRKEGKFVRKGAEKFRKQQVTVRLSKGFFRDKKAEFADYLEHRNVERLKYGFNALNGFPAWRGIIAQKRQLKNFIFAESKKHGVSLDLKDFVVVDTRQKESSIFATIEDLTSEQ